MSSALTFLLVVLVVWEQVAAAQGVCCPCWWQVESAPAAACPGWLGGLRADLRATCHRSCRVLESVPLRRQSGPETGQVVPSAAHIVWASGGKVPMSCCMCWVVGGPAAWVPLRGWVRWIRLLVGGYRCSEHHQDLPAYIAGGMGGWVRRGGCVCAV